MKTILIVLIIGYVIFELVEHLVLPVVFSLKSRKNKSACGVSAMIGKIVEVREWKGEGGQVFFNGELWSAVSDGPMAPRSRAVIEEVKGLVLKVKPLKDEVYRKGSKTAAEE
jgi:membrane-bound ClpP family serine protease